MPYSTDAINNIAYTTPVAAPLISDDIVASVQYKELSNILGSDLYSVYAQYPAILASIEETVILPFVAYSVKYQILINQATEAIEANDTLISSIQSTNSILRQHKSNLQNHLYDTYGILPKSAGGFKIPESILTLSEKDMEIIITPPTAAEDLAPFVYTIQDEEITSFTLPEKLKKGSLVFVNNIIIDPALYTGTGTTTLTFATAFSTYDKLVVTF